jgi:NAD(P)H dehydrogenase (quinone)
MYVVMGVTGQVGSVIADSLLATGLPVRAVVRSYEKGTPWAAKGCEIAIAEIMDTDALARAFSGAKGVFLMSPPDYDPEPGFPRTVKSIAAVTAAIHVGRPEKVVFLSTVGAHVAEPTLLNNSKMMEEALRSAPASIGFLRAGWFMENVKWDVESARTGVLPSFLQPLEHRIPMVATVDIGRTAAAMLGESWTGIRIVELEGPRRYSADDIGKAFSSALGIPVRIHPVARDEWEPLFRSEGMKNPVPRIRMIDGFNEGWVDFEGGAAEHRQGPTELKTVIAELVAR